MRRRDREISKRSDAVRRHELARVRRAPAPCRPDLDRDRDRDRDPDPDPDPDRDPDPDPDPDRDPDPSTRRLESTTGAIPEDRARVETSRLPANGYFVTFASSTMTGYA
jgi:hypothetical protein